MSSSKEATRAVNLRGSVFQPLATIKSRSKQTSSVAALQADLRRTKLLNGQSFEHLKAGGDPVENLKGDPVKKNEQHIGEDGLDWWEVTRYIRYTKYITYIKYVKSI